MNVYEGSINGSLMTWKKSFKWMWCQNAASDVDAIRCTSGWKWCQYVVAFGLTAIRWQTVDARVAPPDRNEIRCTGGYLIVKLLHLMPMSSNARWRLSDCQNCIRCRCHRMHWRNCLFVRLLHLTAKRSNARWQLSVAKVRCSQLTVMSFAKKLKKQKPVTTADATSFAMMSKFCIRC